MMITRKSELTGKVHHMELNVTHAQLVNYERGMNIQAAFPDLDADQKEFMKSGITPQEWDEMWEGK